MNLLRFLGALCLYKAQDWRLAWSMRATLLDRMAVAALVACGVHLLLR